MTGRGRLGLSLQLLGLTGVGVMVGADILHWLTVVVALAAIVGGIYLWVAQPGGEA